MHSIISRIGAALFLVMLSFTLVLPTALAADPVVPQNTKVYDPAKLQQDNLKRLPTLATGVQKDPGIIIANVINIAMGFLGVIAVCIIVYAGFKWMTAGGEKENTEAATKLMVNGIIGLVIILASWILANFVISQITNVLK